MKLLSYLGDDGVRSGVLTPTGLIDLENAGRAAGVPLPAHVLDLLLLGSDGLRAVELALAIPQAPVGKWQAMAPIQRFQKNIFAVGHNYRAHLEEAASAHGIAPVMPTRATFFSKPPTAVIGPDAGIVLDARATSELDYEVELGVVIGRSGRNIKAATALDHVYGYTIGNDISARDVQRAHGQFFKGKAMDTFCPIGPCLVPSEYLSDPQDLHIQLRVNGEIRQDSRTSDMIFPIAEIIEQLSVGLTLEPGDLILTGTPSGVALGMTPQRWLAVGDVVEAEIEGIGVLRNHVVGAIDGDAAIERPGSARYSPSTV